MFFLHIAPTNGPETGIFLWFHAILLKKKPPIALGGIKIQEV